MDRLIEIIRKLAVIGSYIVIGGSGVGFFILGVGEKEPAIMGVGMALVILSWLVHKVLNWIFQ